MPCKIINNSGLEISGFEDMIQSLVSFSQDRFGFEKPPSIFLDSDSDNASNPLGKTAYYDPTRMAVHVYTDDRHPKDIMRSISHELVHHNQNCQGNKETCAFVTGKTVTNKNNKFTMNGEQIKCL
jgi:hypothetical protein